MPLMQNNILKNFIVFEGLDGAGTSTQSKLLHEQITNSELTFEPTDNEVGKLIRRCLRKEVKLTQGTLSYLFASDRAEHLYNDNGIIKKCNEGKIIICDRYIFSSFAYQMLDVSFELILKLNKDFLLPEIVFFLNTSIDECQDRVVTRGENEELFENRSLQEKILQNYKEAFSYYEKLGLNIIELNGNLSKEVLIKKEVESLKKINII